MDIAWAYILQTKINNKNTKISEQNVINATAVSEKLIDKSIFLKILAKVVNENFDSFKINNIYNYDKKTFHTNGIIDLTNTKIEVSRLNYIKENGNESQVSFEANFIYDKYYNIKNLNFSISCLLIKHHIY